MTLIPWNTRERCLNTFSNDFFENSWTPALDVYDSKENILVKADLPGLRCITELPGG